MDETEYINLIIKGAEKYFQMFSFADNITHVDGDIEWIAPFPDSRGPAIVFRVNFKEENVDKQLDELLPSLDSGSIPSFWVITPNSTPENIISLLETKGFKNLTDPEKPEYGMALDIMNLQDIPNMKSDIKITKVTSMSEFELWIEVVNKALHGWDMLSMKHYSSWLLHKDISFYLAYWNGKPAATVCTIQSDDTASVEFVSTLEEYRNRGIATEICYKILSEIKQTGIRTVTLRSSHEAFSLYKKLGFEPYYEQILLLYQKR